MAQIERLGQPIGEQDLDALESLADARAIAHGGMPLEALDGFFSALVVGPGPLVEPAEYLPLALGDEGPEPAAEEVAVALGLLFKLWNHVVWRVMLPIPEQTDDSEEAAQRDFELLPFVGLPLQEAGDDSAMDDDPMAGVSRDFPVGALWAGGFLQGVSLRPEGWSAWAAADEDLARDLEDMVRLSIVNPEQSEEMGFDWNERFDFDQRWDLLASVPALLQDLYLTRLEEEAGPPEPIRRAPLPGRNDPCTCGSGLKWKKCCGRSLH